MISITTLLAISAFFLYIKIDLDSFESRSQLRKRTERENTANEELETQRTSGNLLDAITLTANHYA